MLPPLDAPAAQIAAFYGEQSQNGMYRLSSYPLELQMVRLALFFGGLYALLRRHEGASGALSAAVFAAGLALTVIIPVVDMIEDHLLLGLAAAGGDALMHYFATQRPTPAFPELTEREILAMIAQVWNNSEIAGRLVVSLKTVRNHVSNIFSKLEVSDRAEAIVRARKAGLGREGERRYSNPA